VAGGGGCGLTPTATWLANPPSALPNESVTFTFQGTGEFTAYSWVFGDGTTGSGTSVTHAYGAAGTYNVAVTAVPDPACGPPVTSAPKTFLVTPFLTADFTWTPINPTVGVTVAFTGTVSGGTAPYTWGWDFGDSGTSTVQSPTHAYSSQNNYTVSLTVNDSGSETYTRTYQINVGPAQCQVPDVGGMIPANAQTAWVNAGFLSTTLVFSPPAKNWGSATVAWQSLSPYATSHATVLCSSSMTVKNH